MRGLKRFGAAFSAASVAIKSVAACAAISSATAVFTWNFSLDAFKRADGRKRLTAAVEISELVTPNRSPNSGT